MVPPVVSASPMRHWADATLDPSLFRPEILYIVPRKKNPPSSYPIPPPSMFSPEVPVVKAFHKLGVVEPPVAVRVELGDELLDLLLAHDFPWMNGSIAFACA